LPWRFLPFGSVQNLILILPFATVAQKMTLIKPHPSHSEDTLHELFVNSFDWDPEDQGDVTLTN